MCALSDLRDAFRTRVIIDLVGGFSDMDVSLVIWWVTLNSECPLELVGALKRWVSLLFGVPLAIGALVVEGVYRHGCPWEMWVPLVIGCMLLGGVYPYEFVGAHRKQVH